MPLIKKLFPRILPSIQPLYVCNKKKIQNKNIFRPTYPIFFNLRYLNTTTFFLPQAEIMAPVSTYFTSFAPTCVLFYSISQLCKMTYPWLTIQIEIHPSASITFSLQNCRPGISSSLTKLEIEQYLKLCNVMCWEILSTY